MPNLVLDYFVGGRGRVELARLICVACNIKFTNYLTQAEDWPKKKPTTPLGFLPVIHVDDVVIPQSIAIARYLALEGNLVGRTNLEQLEADAIVLTIYDGLNILAREAIEHLVKEDPTDFNEGLKRYRTKNFDTHFGNIEKLISLYGQDGYAVGNALTWADIYVFDMHSKIMLLYKDESLFIPYDRVRRVVERVLENENIANYVKTRPDAMV